MHSKWCPWEGICKQIDVSIEVVSLKCIVSTWLNIFVAASDSWVLQLVYFNSLFYHFKNKSHIFFCLSLHKSLMKSMLSKVEENLSTLNEQLTQIHTFGRGWILYLVHQGLFWHLLYTSITWSILHVITQKWFLAFKLLILIRKIFFSCITISHLMKSHWTNQIPGWLTFINR